MPDPHTTAPKNGWPLFVLAGLSFVPVLGIFMGLGAVCWGLVANRRRAMLAAGIGAAGMAFNVGLFAFLIYLGDRSGLMTQTNVEMTRRDLETLVERIEAYRERHAAYPASLPALLERRPSLNPVNIYDMAGGAFRIPRPYEYRLAPDGRTYDLFSAGPDRRPGTDDDIRPELPDSLRDRTGFRPPREIG